MPPSLDISVHHSWASGSNSDRCPTIGRLTRQAGLYGGSKAAIDIVSETLRLELAPFDVKVITCVAGVVQTKLMSNSRKEEPPTGSLYASIADKIATRARGEDILKDAGSPQDFARQLLDQVLNGVNGYVYCGTYSTVTRILSRFMPAFILVSVRELICWLGALL